MQKKSFTYKEAIKATLCYLGVIIMIGSNCEGVRGPSNWGIDNRQGDFSFTRHYLDAAPLTFKIPNCRKNKIPIVTDNKKLICCNRKDPTLFGFLRYFSNNSTIENKIVF